MGYLSCCKKKKFNYNDDILDANLINSDDKIDIKQNIKQIENDNKLYGKIIDNDNKIDKNEIDNNKNKLDEKATTKTDNFNKKEEKKIAIKLITNYKYDSPYLFLAVKASDTFSQVEKIYILNILF